MNKHLLKKTLYYIQMLLWLLFWVQEGFSQDTLQIKDITNTSKDSINQVFYENIQEISKKKPFYQKLHHLIFRTINTESNSKIVKKNSFKDPRSWKDFQQKPIRHIHITTLAPFGYDEKDSTQKPNKWEHLANKLHFNTQKKIIKRILLFTQNEPLDSLLLLESERLLREENYIRRAHITAQHTATKDSVDIFITTMDSWTLFADADGATDYARIRIQERNMFGMGNLLSVRLKSNFNQASTLGNSFYYEARDFYNTDINPYLYYEKTTDNYYDAQIGAYKYYTHHYTKWAGGILLNQQTFRKRIPYLSAWYDVDFKTFIQDYWLSYSFPILQNFKKAGTHTRLTTSIRFKEVNYLKNSYPEADPSGFFTKSQLYLGAISIHNYTYEQDRYIFRHEDIEDVPVGKSLTYIGGFEQKLGEKEVYAGIQAKYARYWDIGYVNASIEIGGFLSKNSKKKGALQLNISYFSQMFQIYKWKFRQFVNYRNTMGFYRDENESDRINLNGYKGMIGYNSPILYGTRRHILSLQTQSYIPFSIIGFRVSPFLTYEIGGIGTEGHSFLKDSYYTKIGIGFHITNDYLLFGNFQFSFFYFPRIEGVGNHIQKFTGTRNDDFRLPNFQYQAPTTIRYE